MIQLLGGSAQRSADQRLSKLPALRVGWAPRMTGPASEVMVEGELNDCGGGGDGLAATRAHAFGRAAAADAGGRGGAALVPRNAGAAGGGLTAATATGGRGGGGDAGFGAAVAT